MAKDFELNIKSAKQDKPRICEVLGVEVGERFTYKDPSDGAVDMMVNSDGHMTFFLNSQNIGSIGQAYGLVNAINHPNRIIRKPRFTEDEITFMRYLYGCGVREIERPSDAGSDVSAFAEKVGNGRRRMWWLPPVCLPSLRPGQSVTLEEVVGQ